MSHHPFGIIRSRWREPEHGNTTPQARELDIIKGRLLAVPDFGTHMAVSATHKEPEWLREWVRNYS